MEQIIEFPKAWVRWKRKSSLIKKDLKVIQLHYHLRPGGVTTVIGHIQNCLNQLGITNGILHGDHQAPTHLNETQFSPLLSYHSFDSPDAGKILDYFHSVFHKEKKELILWCHNPNLGKNPALTEALWRLSLNPPSGLHLIFHIHDFPEDNRNSNMLKLQKYEERHQLPKLIWMYPKGTWLCLNQYHKEKYLSKPEQGDVMVIPNPVNKDTGSTLTAGEIRRMWFDFINQFDFNGNENDQLLIYPGRMLIRKNPYEALLLGKILGHQFHVLFTLSPTTDNDWSKQLLRFLRENNCNASIGFGQHYQNILGYADLMKIAHTSIHTSLQEGFGYGLIEPFIYGKKVLARKVTGTCEYFSSLGMILDGFYTKLPLAESINGISDFGLLPEKEKLNILKDNQWKNVIDPGFTSFVKKFVSNQSRINISANAEIIGKNLHLDTYQNRIKTILNSLPISQ